MLRRSPVRAITAYGFGQPRMDQGFGPVNPKQPAHPAAGAVATTTLPNGTKVVSHEKGGALASVGIYVDAGVKYDPLAAPGLSHVMSWAMLTSNLKDSLFQINRALNAVGASWGEAEVNKRWLGWTAEMPREHWKVGIENIGTCLAAPRFCEPDIERGRDTLDAQNEESRWKTPRDYVVDQLETVAFYKEPLGNPRMVPPETNDRCTTVELLNKYATYMTPQRAVVVGVNVDHQELCAFYSTGLTHPHDGAAPHFRKAIAPGSAPASELSQFQGGNERVHVEDRPSAMTTKCDWQPEGIVAVGWGVPVGADGTAAERATGLVLRELLNVSTQDGIRFDRSDAHRGIRSFFRPYASAGLIGYTVRERPEHLGAAVTGALKALPTDFVSGLAAAKARAVSTLQAETQETLRAYGAHLATSKHTAAELEAAIQGVTSGDLGKAVDAMKAGKPAMFGTGNIAALPSLRQFMKA